MDIFLLPNLLLVEHLLTKVWSPMRPNIFSQGAVPGDGDNSSFFDRG